MIIRWVILMTASFSFLGCAPLHLYHSPNNTCSERDKDSCSDHYIEQGDGYRLGFVEIDDKGWFHDPGQLAAIREEVSRHDEILLLVFAHGWKHNADNNDRDLKRMRNILTDLAEYERNNVGQGNQPRQVVGMYLGWRGLSVKIPILKEFSFWERKSTAHNAGEAASTILSELQYLIDQKRASGSSSSYVIVGHSFGGALVYSAMRPHIYSRLIKQRHVIQAFDTITPSSDLVVLINPAFEAAQVSELQRVYRDETGSPYLVVLTADNDYATKLAFPVGRHLSTLFDRYTSREQKNADRHAIGHHKPYWTHVIEDIEDTQGNGCGKQYQQYQTQMSLLETDHIDQWLRDYDKSGHSLLLNDTQIKHRVPPDNGVNPDNPIQIVQVRDRDILDKHSNIVCDDLVDLIRSYIIFNTRYALEHR